MATMPNTNINIPYSAFLDPTTGRPSQAWLLWLMSPSFISVNLGSALPVTSGGTGLTTIPTNGQLLIGNGTGYTLNTLGTGAGISVTNGLGTITVANTGVLSNLAGSGISVSSATGNVTIANTGVLSWAGGTTGLTPAAATTGAVTLSGTLIAANGGTGFSSYAVGDLLYADTTTTLAKLPDVATGNALISGGISTAPAWGKIGLTTHVSGILPIANGGTNATVTPTAGAVAYGTGTAYGFTAAGTAGQVLTSAGAGVPTWTTNASGDVSGPASSTDNAIARFDGVTGKLIQNSVTTIDDTGAATGFTTFAASTSVTTPIVQASNSAGLSLKNASGTTQMSVGAGGGDNMSINVSTNLNGANAQIDLSPTGTGHVHIKPTGVNSVEIAPTFVGEMDNITIGATTPKNGSFVDLSVTGTTSFDGSQGTAGQVLTSAGTGATPTWTTPTGGTVTAVSVVSANGFAGTSSGGATPALTLTTTITGLLKGNGTAISAAVANTDYIPLSTVLTKTSDYTITGTDTWIINNKPTTALTLTFPAASSWTGRYITVKNMQAQAVNSASSNIVPIDSTVAGTAILLGVVGNWATLVSDGTNWVIMQAASNNNLLLE
ncbi:hypothetical protein UFOVP632_18 [uncultured Caudovirales phage]|uniref:Uncharacterized protein n=1 Tax=uncultured Caudovirales phage TaxID=2100421 RepID=A0A6J5QLJ1_9CAUD|nr:hypothetical protein UFOVP632_18 [uncultured Caudovirales phage]CAB4184622.1 hypothetical protein UFOVP1117_21 [uncultured Caudovirales phage]CAB5229899.1 hypothetical protein UFOVP1570_22 [uncultured Caudovirales phage]